MTERRNEAGARIARAARGLLGVPFRLHGRDRTSGVDCIGLALLALEEAGCTLRADAPRGYSARGGSIERFAAHLAAAGFRKVRRRQAGEGQAGDLLLVRAGVAQYHLMIAAPGGHIHADAGLGRVVETPGAPPWPVLGRWRWRAGKRAGKE